MAKYSRHDESVLHFATPKSNSLRTTVPAYIVNQFNLKKGNKLYWGIENGAIIIQVAQPESQSWRDRTEGPLGSPE